MSELWDDTQAGDEGALGAFMNVFPSDPAEPQENQETGPAEPQATEDVPAAEGKPDPGETTGAEAGDDVGTTHEEPAAAGELLLGKFKSVEDLAKAYENVESYSGRAAWERDEALRYAKQLEERLQTLQQPAAQPQAPHVDWDTLIDEKPAVAAQYARQLGDNVAFQRAMVAWEEMAPGTPAVWLENQRLREELGEVRKAIEPTQQTVQEQRVKQEVAEAYERIVAAYPDFDEYRGEIAQEVARLTQGGNPALRQTMENGTAEQRFAALEHLYFAARGRKAGDAAEIAKRAAQIHAEETQRAKAEAQTASAATTGQADLSPAEQVAEQWKNLMAPLEDGFLVMPGS